MLPTVAGTNTIAARQCRVFPRYTAAHCYAQAQHLVNAVIPTPSELLKKLKQYLCSSLMR